MPKGYTKAGALALMKRLRKHGVITFSSITEDDWNELILSEDQDGELVEARRLLQAAPDLLSACKSALLWLLHEGYPEDNAQVMRCADAIRKATGSEAPHG